MRVQPVPTGTFAGSVSQYHARAGTLSARENSILPERAPLTLDGPASCPLEPGTKPGALVNSGDLGEDLLEQVPVLPERGVDTVEAPAVLPKRLPLIRDQFLKSVEPLVVLPE